jgi:hypothetical protein
MKPPADRLEAVGDIDLVETGRSSSSVISPSSLSSFISFACPFSSCGMGEGSVETGNGGIGTCLASIIGSSTTISGSSDVVDDDIVSVVDVDAVEGSDAISAVWTSAGLALIRDEADPIRKCGR